MSVRDKSDAITTRALMVSLRKSTVLKYIVSMSENTTYPEQELITKICYHIKAKKTSNLEASKLSQEILLGGKHKLDSQVSTSKPNDNGNKKKARMATKEETIKFQGSRTILLSLLMWPQFILRPSTKVFTPSPQTSRPQSTKETTPSIVGTITMLVM